MNKDSSWKMSGKRDLLLVVSGQDLDKSQVLSHLLLPLRWNSDLVVSQRRASTHSYRFY